MTVKCFNKHIAKPKSISTIICFCLAFLMIMLGDNMRAAINDGLKFSFTTIIPTLFPFFILSDLWVSVFYINPNGHVSRAFEKIFRINGSAITALLSGYICGFPLGVKVASELYRENKITKNEFEQLSGFVNNPSMAFVISGVGAGIFKNIRLGIILYLSVIISSILTGFLFRSKQLGFLKQSDNIRQRFVLTDSIKNAGVTSVNVISCIIFFSGLIGLFSAIIKDDFLTSLFSMLLEVTNAVKVISANGGIPLSIRLGLTAFALCFSGFSVHIQAFCFMPEEASRLKYLLMKMVQGVISFMLIFLFCILKK